MRFTMERRPTLRGRRWFWRLQAANGEVVAQGHTRGYANRADCDHAIGLVRGTGSWTTLHVRET